jgi:flagellar hook-associated protein 3 FlgL
MTSIGSYAQNQFVLRNNTEAQARVQEYRIQVSTGYKAQRYDGISADSRRLESLEQQHAQNRAFTKSIERTELRLDMMESSVEGLQDIAKEFRTTLLSAANAENLQSLDLTKIASDLREQAVALVNTEVEGRFLFSGSDTRTAPVGTDATSAPLASDLFYQGNTDTLSVRADKGVTLDYGITAAPGANNGIEELLTSLTQVMGAGVTQDDLTAALDALTGETNATGGAIAKLADTRAQIGSSLDLMEGIRTRLEDNQVDVEAGISDIEDVDVSRAMTLLAEQQTTLETSYAVTARLARTSLLNFL